MQTVFDITSIPLDQADVLEQLVVEDSSHPELDPAMRDVLLSLAGCIREGVEFHLDGSSVVTPTQAATRLGMSRTHLYKLLDQGEILSHRVGRDRRIRVSDLANFEAHRQRDSRELAERFAQKQQIHARVIDEIADLL